KKNREEMANSREVFVKRAIENGHNEKTASRVFDLIERFANYGFNKSHSVAYSMIACSMAYLKAYYPLEFYSAILETSSSTNDTKFNEYVSEMKKRDIKIVAPDINLSHKEFIVKDDTLLYPLSAIHSINELLVNNILIERNNGLFKDFFDFVSRMFKYKISETQITRLIDAGCFDAFDSSRASFRASIKSALQYAELSYKEDGQLDIGVSSMQIDTPERGFSFRFDAPLSMAMGQNNLDAKEVINNMSESELSDIFYKYGEEPRSRAIARRIVSIRGEKPIKTTFELVNIIKNIVGEWQATKVVPRIFQALRIYVNDELGELEKVLGDSESILSSGGRLVVVDFHSLEDRIVKNFIKEKTEIKQAVSRYIPMAIENNQKLSFKSVNKNAIIPSKQEVEMNPRAHSAKLRVMEKL
ncbi:MAG: 16S rRNA (cytosine(1402)-N(4))-methyltransferase RsmH, partial [Alphaproteobacteria bacterium]|nr:16S rRNA (cytosine(1402)-N(4))-methyltransferase RsmH [Alphaproteobacteria bacterium]